MQPWRLSLSAWAGRKRPSERIDLVLRGKVPLEGEDRSVQSVCSKHIFDGAIEILNMPTKADRQIALSKTPPLIRPHIEAETLRVWKERRK